MFNAGTRTKQQRLRGPRQTAITKRMEKFMEKMKGVLRGRRIAITTKRSRS